MKPPGALPELQRRISRYAASKNIPVGRVQQRVACEVIFNVLEQARTNGIMLYVVKGGMALEVRHGLRARASYDVDIALHVPFDRLIQHFDAAMALGFDAFTLSRRPKSHLLENAKTLRLEVEIAYDGRSFSRLSVDLNEAHFEPATEAIPSAIMPHLGLPGPVLVQLLATPAQIAHKIHGATQPSSNEYNNVRYRDVIDTLIATSDEIFDYDNLRDTCTAEFARRGGHTWPPRLVLNAQWRDGLEKVALDNSFQTTDPENLSHRFNRIVDRIEGAYMPPRFETFIAQISSGTLANVANAEGGVLGEIRKRLEQGWRISHALNNPANNQSVTVTLERTIDDEVPARPLRASARMQLRLKSDGEGRLLSGVATNYGALGTRRTRLIIPGYPDDYGPLSPLRLGSLAPAETIDIEIPYGQTGLSGIKPSEPIAIEYLDDQDRKFRQTATLETFASFDRRLCYQCVGLGPPVPIERFSVRHDDGEQI